MKYESHPEAEQELFEAASRYEVLPGVHRCPPDALFAAGEPFRGHDVSLDSLSDLIVKLALSPTMEVRGSLGVSRP